MEMEDLDFQKICRICLGSGTMMSLFKVSMFKKIMAIASVQVWPTDGLPGQICTRCASKLHIAFQLKKQCEKSDLKLRQFQMTMLQEEKKLAEDPPQPPPNLELTDNPLQQQVANVQQSSDRMFIQETHNLMNNMKPEPYNDFMQVPQNQLIPQVAYTCLTATDGQMPAYDMPPGHNMVYNHQYTIDPAQQIQENGHMLPIGINTSQTLQPKLNHEIPDNNRHLDEKEDDVKEQDGKECSTCGKVFKTNIKLNRHMKIHNTSPSERPYKCQYCGKGFSHGGNFKIHLRIHNNERPFKCPVCSKGCRQAQDLEKHMRTHTGERPHKCNFCPKAFATSSNLTAHVRIHTGERPYVCCVCQKAFCQSNELTKHMRTHTGEKSHICDVCNKGFNGSSGLLAHRRLHTGERPYSCPHCDRGFTSSNCLSSHIKTHNKSHPLKCLQCEQEFANLSSLKDHITQEHNHGGSIQCRTCDNSFRRVNEYLAHVRTHEIVTS